MAWDVITVADEWVFDTLTGAPAVTALLGSGDEARIWPAFAPELADFPYAVHDYAGGHVLPQPLGDLPPTAFVLAWQVAVWGEGSDRTELRPAMTAILGALVGGGMTGTRAAPFQSNDGSRWSVNCYYVAPVPTPAEVGENGVYQRVTHEVKIELQRLS